MTHPFSTHSGRKIYETAFDSRVGPSEIHPEDAMSLATKTSKEEMTDLATILQESSLVSPQLTKKASSVSLLERCRKWRTAHLHSANDSSKSSPTSPVVETYCCSPARQRSSNSTTTTPCLSLTRLWNSTDLDQSDKEDDDLVQGNVQSSVNFPIPIQNLASSPRKFRVPLPTSEWGTSSESVSSVEVSSTSSIVSSRESLRSFSSSVSSQSSDFSYAPKKKMGLALVKNYCQVLSPISDKSAETNSPKDYLPSPATNKTLGTMSLTLEGMDMLRHKQVEDEEQHTASDSGISTHSHDTTQEDLPFYMPKLRRNRTYSANTQSDGPSEASTTRANLSLSLTLNTTRPKPKLPTVNVLPTKNLHINSKSSNNRPSLEVESEDSQTDLENKELPFFMPKLHRKDRDASQHQPFFKNGGMHLALKAPFAPPVQPSLQEIVDAKLPLEDQGWYHGAIPRNEAEIRLRHSNEGSFLVRSAPKLEYYLSAKTLKGFIHVRISCSPNRCEFRLHVESSNNVSQASIPSLINHWARTGVPLPDSTCLYLRYPVIEQLL